MPSRSAPNLPGRPRVGDVGLPEAVGEDPESEIDAAAAEEERADEEEPGEKDADPTMGAVDEVLVDRPRTGVPTRVKGDGVGDRDDAESKSEYELSAARRYRLLREKRAEAATKAGNWTLAAVTRRAAERHVTAFNDEMAVLTEDGDLAQKYFIFGNEAISAIKKPGTVRRRLSGRTTR